jgi:hypothetical protein
VKNNEISALFLGIPQKFALQFLYQSDRKGEKYVIFFENQLLLNAKVPCILAFRVSTLF